MEVLQKTENRTTTPAIPLPVTYPKLGGGEGKTNSKRHTHPVFITALFIIAKIWKQPKCPSTDEWIKKM